LRKGGTLLSEPEAASHFKKVHRLFEDDKNGHVFQRSHFLLPANSFPAVHVFNAKQEE
jgi:hypothetical protein